MNIKQNAEKQDIKVNFTKQAETIAYTNITFVNNTTEEFLLDFGTVAPGREGVDIFSRVAISPRNAKLFASGLVERLKQYEAQNGEIKLPESGK
jgi:hypothetical protein